MNTSQIFGTFLKLVLRQGSDLELGLGSILKKMLEYFRIQLKPIKVFNIRLQSCGSGTNPGSELFHPGSRVKKIWIPDSDPHQRI
jgi:hypothetical protein